jgi:hypothetical protein
VASSLAHNLNKDNSHWKLKIISISATCFVDREVPDKSDGLYINRANCMTLSLIGFR